MEEQNALFAVRMTTTGRGRTCQRCNLTLGPEVELIYFHNKRDGGQGRDLCPGCSQVYFDRIAEQEAALARAEGMPPPPVPASRRKWFFHRTI